MNALSAPISLCLALRAWKGRDIATCPSFAWESWVRCQKLEYNITWKYIFLEWTKAVCNSGVVVLLSPSTISVFYTPSYLIRRNSAVQRLRWEISWLHGRTVREIVRKKKRGMRRGCGYGTGLVLLDWLSITHCWDISSKICRVIATSVEWKLMSNLMPSALICDGSCWWQSGRVRDLETRSGYKALSWLISASRTEDREGWVTMGLRVRLYVGSTEYTGWIN
jgi:hypothetical protein